jgi:hypothetical protein
MSNIELYTPETNNEIETKINLLQKNNYNKDLTMLERKTLEDFNNSFENLITIMQKKELPNQYEDKFTLLNKKIVDLQNEIESMTLDINSKNNNNMTTYSEKENSILEEIKRSNKILEVFQPYMLSYMVANYDKLKN